MMVSGAVSYSGSMAGQENHMDNGQAPRNADHLAHYWRTALRPWQRFITLRSAGRIGLASVYRGESAEVCQDPDRKARCQKCRC